MPSKTSIRNVVAVAAATLTVAALPTASQAAVTAARYNTSTTSYAAAPSRTSTAQVRPTTTTTRPTSTSVAYVTAGSTGDGPADQGECDRWAININHYLNLAEASAQSGTSDAQTDAYAQQSAAYEDQAMDRGCFIVD
jgi:hypothetical protein